MTKEFAGHETATLLGTWWGIIGCILGPVYLVSNILEYIAGTADIVFTKKPVVVQYDGWSHVADQKVRDLSASRDYDKIGESLSEIFVKPTVWQWSDKLSGYRVPEVVAQAELAMARIGIINSEISKLDDKHISDSLRSGIDRYARDSLRNVSKVDVRTVLRLYESVADDLDELSRTVSNRIAVVGLTPTNISAHFGEVKREAETLLRYVVS
jgi:hypothetical protein